MKIQKDIALAWEQIVRGRRPITALSVAADTLIRDLLAEHKEAAQPEGIFKISVSFEMPTDTEMDLDTRPI